MTTNPDTTVTALLAALKPLLDIAEAWDGNQLDGDARKWRLYKNAHNASPPTDVELYATRHGRQLLTLSHCLAARDLVMSITQTRTRRGGRGR